MCMAELYSKSQPTTSQILSDSSVRSVERAIEVLFSFTQQEPVLDIPALQQRTGLSRPTLYRLLRTLETRGLIYSFGNPLRFQLGARTGLLASTWTPAPGVSSFWGRFVFVVKSDGRRSSTGVGVACQAIDFIGFPVDFFDRRLRAQKRARFQPPVPVFGVVCDGRISLA